MFSFHSLFLWREGPLHQDHLCLNLHHQSNVFVFFYVVVFVFVFGLRRERPLHISQRPSLSQPSPPKWYSTAEPTWDQNWRWKLKLIQPPIVWFPGDPDCGEGDLGGDPAQTDIYLLIPFFVLFLGNVQMDTFQLIAFLLSVFNIASLMVSNVNNNNNNNNINDNEANVNDNNINESNTNAMVNSMVMVGLGGRSYGTRTEAEGEIQLMKCRLVNSIIWDCGLHRFGICFRGVGKHHMEPSSSGDDSLSRPFYRLEKIIDVMRDMLVCILSQNS